MKRQSSPIAPLAALACAFALQLSPSSARADTISGSGPYSLVVRTCAGSESGTAGSVYVTLQSDKQLHRMTLSSPSGARTPNSQDTHRFSWPQGLPAVRSLEQIKLETAGADTWCIDSVALNFKDQAVWRWTSTQDYRGRVMTHPWQGRGGIVLNGTYSLDGRSKTVPNFVRFADASVTEKSPAYAATFGGSHLRVQTCSAVTSASAGSNSTVEVMLMHDGIGDLLSFKKFTFRASGSTVTRPLAGAKDGILNYAQKLDALKISKSVDGDDWCIQAVALDWQGDGSEGGTYWSSAERTWLPREDADDEGEESDGLGLFGREWRPAAWISSNRCTSGCVSQRYYGFPLQRGTWNRALANCASNRETCNGRDDNCDGQIDEGLATATYYPDADLDGYGVSSDMVSHCALPAGYARVAGDCAPARADTHPGASEVCDERDNNCDGRVDEGVRNGCGGCGAVPDETCNGLDDDCDGAIDDGLSSVPERCNHMDDNCDGLVDEEAIDANACGFCGDLPLETCNNIDDDCDGEIDESATDVNACGICGPQPMEACNGRDDDCDGQVDEGYSEPRTCGYGVCQNRHGVAQCVRGEVRDLCTPLPPTGDDSDCDGLDNDCDGEVDEGFFEEPVQCTGSCGVRSIRCVNGQIVNECHECESAH